MTFSQCLMKLGQSLNRPLTAEEIETASFIYNLTDQFKCSNTETKQIYESDNWIMRVNKDKTLTISYFDDCGHYCGEIVIDTNGYFKSVVRATE